MRALGHAREAKSHSRSETGPQAGAHQAPASGGATREIKCQQAEAGRGVAAREAAPRESSGRGSLEQAEVGCAPSIFDEIVWAAPRAERLEYANSGGGERERQAQEQQDATALLERWKDKRQYPCRYHCAGDKHDYVLRPLVRHDLERGVVSHRKATGCRVEEPVADDVVESGGFEGEQQGQRHR